ncbi:beta-ketoacyl synthase N-terminal-like domain-containing protein [Methyloraptor flagellatus]|uniref:Beta-ketoacyl synthase N-terminal-like domain-containing protein n=1 Tax=Methyloraptor flagellatus TaxID=3162530 RepID=A0AAU7XG47_9HYPH
MRRVVVSGLGVVSSAGTSVEAFWANLVAGTGAFAEAASSPGTGIRVGAVIGDDHARDLPLPSLAPLDRSGVFAVAAAGQALADAGLTTPFARPERVAVILGCGGGGLSSMDEQFRRLYAEKSARTRSRSPAPWRAAPRVGPRSPSARAVPVS